MLTLFFNSKSLNTLYVQDTNGYPKVAIKYKSINKDYKKVYFFHPANQIKCYLSLKYTVIVYGKIQPDYYNIS